MHHLIVIFFTPNATLLSDRPNNQVVSCMNLLVFLANSFSEYRVLKEIFLEIIHVGLV